MTEPAAAPPGPTVASDAPGGERLRRLMAEAAVIVAQIDPTRRWADLNEVWLAVTGESLADALAMPAVDVEDEIEQRHKVKLEAVGRLAAGIAHEINTPIQFIGDNLYFLLEAFAITDRLITTYREALHSTAENWVERRALLEDAEREADFAFLQSEVPNALRQARDGVERVATIVRAMKAFGHPDQGEPEPVDLNQILSDTLVVARNELKYVADTVTDLGDLPLVVCFPGDVNQVVLNLLVNAAHAIADRVGDSGERGTITVTTTVDGGDVMVSVADDGAGIPEEIRRRVFDPFFTTKEVGRGTGQGLALARAVIVDRHGGDLRFTSEMGRGTTFTLRLPVAGRPHRGEAS